MNFSDYLKQKKITLRVAEAETGISYELLRKYKNGQRRPRVENMLILRNWTNGFVKADDWYMPANDNNEPISLDEPPA